MTQLKRIWKKSWTIRHTIPEIAGRNGKNNETNLVNTIGIPKEIRISYIHNKILEGYAILSCLVGKQNGL